MQAKAATKLTFDLIKDFNHALEVIPDNAENIRMQKERHARLDKYTEDLILYAKGEITELDIPQNITPWTQGKIDAEIECLKTRLTKSDLLIDFLTFLRHESSNLQNFASKFAHFTHQQAWNYAAEGPVGNAAAENTSPSSKYLLRRNHTNRPSWNPLPMTVQTLKEHTAQVYAVSITPDGKHAISGSYDKTCILWDLMSGEAIRTLKGHTSYVNDVSITPDGKHAISGSRDNTCILWDLISGEVIKTLKGHSFEVNAVSITSDGKHAISGSTDNTCILWDLSSGEVLKTIEGHTDDVEAVAITPDGNRALSGSMDNTCILWDLISGNAIKTLKGHNHPVRAVSITPDGKHAISGSMDNTCILWDLISGKAIKILNGHTDDVRAVSITPDGKHAISGSYDKTCILWDLRTGKQLARFIANSAIGAVALYSEGIVLGCHSGDVVMLNVDKALLCYDIAITTIMEIWDFDLQQNLSCSADSPLCGNRFAPPISILTTIEELTKKTGLRPEQSPCLELPDEAWEEPGLLGNCPKCGEALKFNPFVAGGDNYQF